MCMGHGEGGECCCSERYVFFQVRIGGGRGIPIRLSLERVLRWGGGLLPKKCLTRRDLENLSKSDSKPSKVVRLGVGTKLRPLDRTSSERGVRLWLLRLIMYLLLTLLAILHNGFYPKASQSS